MIADQIKKLNRPHYKEHFLECMESIHDPVHGLNPVSLPIR